MQRVEWRTHNFARLRTLSCKCVSSLLPMLLHGMGIEYQGIISDVPPEDSCNGGRMDS